MIPADRDRDEEEEDGEMEMEEQACERGGWVKRRGGQQLH